MTSSLASKVLCVNLKKSCLGTSFVDESLTGTLEVQTGAQPGSVKGSKKILGDALKPMRNLLRTAGALVKENSLPGISDDLRIVTPKALDLIRKELAKIEDEIADEVEILRSQWPQLIEADKIRLDKAFDLSLYPASDELSQYFTVRLTTCDLPQGDYFRVEGLTDESMAKLKEDHAKMIAAVRTAAKNDVHKNLVELIGRIAENLDKPDIGKLHATTFTNLQEYLAKVPDLNITNDPQLEEMRVDALAKLNFTMQQVKASATLKEQAASAAKDILAKFGGGHRKLLLAVEPLTPSAEKAA